MPLTQADKIQIDEYVKNGQIHNARRMLEEDGSAQAMAVLEKLNKRYPPQANTGFDKSVVSPAPRHAPPIARAALPVPPVVTKPNLVEMPSELRLDEMDEIKLAIREKRYDDADALLVLSDHPDAEKLRDRLSQIRGGSGASRAKPHLPSMTIASLSTPSSIRRIAIGVLVVVVLILGLVVVQRLSRDSMIRSNLYDACMKLMMDNSNVPEGFEKTPQEAKDACNESVPELYDRYGGAVSDCYDIYSREEEQVLWLGCIVGNIDMDEPS